jgi:hypothetical protein
MRAMSIRRSVSCQCRQQPSVGVAPNQGPFTRSRTDKQAERRTTDACVQAGSRGRRAPGRQTLPGRVSCVSCFLAAPTTDCPWLAASGIGPRSEGRERPSPARAYVSLLCCCCAYNASLQYVNSEGEERGRAKKDGDGGDARRLRTQRPQQQQLATVADGPLAYSRSFPSISLCSAGAAAARRRAKQKRRARGGKTSDSTAALCKFQGSPDGQT